LVAIQCFLFHHFVANSLLPGLMYTTWPELLVLGLGLKEICPRGNNKVLLFISIFVINVYFFML
jgi:hypothetical protein